MDNTNSVGLNQDQSNTQTVQKEVNVKNRKPLLIIIISFLLISLSIGVYLWQQNIVNKKDQEIKTLSNKIVEINKELENIKNPPISPYCSDGVIFENSSYKYKVCLIDGWKKSPTSSGDENVIINQGEQFNSNYIAIKVSTDFIENALQKYTKDVYVDVADRNYTVDGVEAIQVSGTVKPDKKRAITVLTKDSVTYEVLLENTEDSSYTGNILTYKKIVDSIKFENQKQ